MKTRLSREEQKTKQKGHVTFDLSHPCVKEKGEEKVEEEEAEQNEEDREVEVNELDEDENWEE